MALNKGGINVAGLYAALDAEKDARSLSWRQLAKDRGLSPSTFTRMANGYKPDADAFAVLVRWLGQPADAFILPDGEEAPEPDLVASLAPLLRARKDLTEEDAGHLQALFKSAVQGFLADRERR